MKHNPTRAEHTGAICEECRVVANMLDDGSGYDDVGRAVPKRQAVRRRVGNHPAVEPTVAAQLLFGNVERDEQVRARSDDVRQKRALLAPADIEHDLPGTTVDQVCSLVLVKGLDVALEHRRQPGFGGIAEPLIGGDKAGKQRHRAHSRSDQYPARVRMRFLPVPSSREETPAPVRHLQKQAEPDLPEAGRDTECSKVRLTKTKARLASVAGTYYRSNFSGPRC